MSILAAALEAPGVVKLKEFDRPALGDDEGLLKVEMVGICSTDVKIYHGHLKEYALPLILGHELVGRIEDVGKDMAAKQGPTRPASRRSGGRGLRAV